MRAPPIGSYMVYADYNGMRFPVSGEHSTLESARVIAEREREHRHKREKGRRGARSRIIILRVEEVLL